MLTKQKAIALHHGAILHHATIKNADGTPARCRVNGQCQTWKTRPDDFRLPVKHGLKTCFYITQANAGDWSKA
jgi:hypothetical protein